MTDTATAAKVAMRWSSVRSCPRKAVYEATGAPARDRSRREEGWLWRGKQLGRDFAIILAAEQQKQGKPYLIYVASGDPDEWPARWTTRNRDEAAFVCEEAVEWELGIMHPDIHVLETDTIVEVLSSAHASDLMVRSKMLQLVGQIEHTDAKGGAVVVVNPSNPLDYEVFPLARSSSVYGELVKEMRSRIMQVQAWVGTDGQALPARVCTRPQDARQHFCLHSEHCFAGYEPPLLPLIEDPAARDLAVRLYQIKKQERGIKEQLAPVESERKEIEQRLLDIIPAGKHACQGLEVTRSDVNRGPSFDWKKAEQAGRFSVEDLAEFFKPGATYSTFRVDRVGDQPLDYGDDVPW